MGIKGTVRRSTDGDFIHANVDIDLIISEEPDYGSIEKPVEIFHIIEHFCLGRRRYKYKIILSFRMQSTCVFCNKNCGIFFILIEYIFYIEIKLSYANFELILTNIVMRIKSV